MLHAARFPLPLELDAVVELELVEVVADAVVTPLVVAAEVVPVAAVVVAPVWAVAVAPPAPDEDPDEHPATASESAVVTTPKAEETRMPASYWPPSRETTRAASSQ
jgi:hypothetical protein